MENIYREQVDAYIDSKWDEMLEDIKALVSIDSQRMESKEGMPFGEGPAKVLACACQLMEKYGLKVKNYDNYVVTGDLGEGEKMLDIIAHMDVVPVTDEWTVTDPFTVKVIGDLMYGRGTADNKGPGIAALYAIRAIHDLNIPLSRSVRLILGSDEECGSHDLEYYYKIEKEAPCTFTPDAFFPVINLEAGRLAKSFTAELGEDGWDADGLKIVSFNGGSKVNVVPQNAAARITGVPAGIVREKAAEAEKKTGTKIKVKEEGGEICLQVRGVSAHGSTPQLGVNAATALLDLLLMLAGESKASNIAMLSKFYALIPHGETNGKTLGIQMEDDKLGALTFNLGILRIEDGKLYGEFDVRAPLCASDENLTDVVREKFSSAGITMEEGLMQKPHYAPEDLPYVKVLLDSYELYTGEKGKCISTFGGTYVHSLERGVAFGCLKEDLDYHLHGDDEFMEISTLIMCTKMFADVIIRLCG